MQHPLVLKMEDAPTLLKIPKSECPDIWIRLPKNGQNHAPVYGRYSRSSRKEICTVILWQAYLWERHFEKVLLETRLGKSSKLGMFV